LDADATLGAVFARLVNADGTLQPSVHDALPTPWSQAGDVLFASSLKYALYRAPALKPALLRGTLRRHAAAHDVAWGGAACLLVRRKAFDAVEGFDERFFMYMEDVDLCARLGAAGFRLRYVPEAVARARGGRRAAGRGCRGHGDPDRRRRRLHRLRALLRLRDPRGARRRRLRPVGARAAQRGARAPLRRRAAEVPAALLRRDAPVDVAAVPRGRPRVARAGAGVAGRDGGARAAAPRGRARAPRRGPRRRRALPAARGDAPPRPGERRRAGPPGPRLAGLAPALPAPRPAPPAARRRARRAGG